MDYTCQFGFQIYNHYTETSMRLPVTHVGPVTRHRFEWSDRYRRARDNRWCASNPNNDNTTTVTGIGRKKVKCVGTVRRVYVLHNPFPTVRGKSGVANAEKKTEGKKNKNIPDPYMSRPRVFGRSLRTRRGMERSAGQPAGTPTSTGPPPPTVSRPPAPSLPRRRV